MCYGFVLYSCLNAIGT